VNNAYTDRPALHPNLLVGSLQLLFWLLFHPSAWHNHLARVDPSLPPDFCLAALSKQQWQNRPLRRLVVMIHLVWPVLITLLFVLMWILAGRSLPSAFFLALVGLIEGIVAGVMLSLVVSVPFGAAVGLSTSLGLGGLPFVLSLSLAASLAANLTLGPDNRNIRDQRSGFSFSLARRAGGIVLGVITSGLVYALAILTLNVALGGVVRSRPALGLLYAVVLALVLGWRTGRWRPSLVVALTAGLFLALASNSLTVSNPVSVSLTQLITTGATPFSGEYLIFFAVVFLLAAVFLALTYLLARWAAGLEAAVVAVAGMLGGMSVFAVFLSGSGATIWPNLSVGLAVALFGLLLPWWRQPLLYPLLTGWNYWLLGRDEAQTRRPHSEQPHRWLLRLHSAFWDEYQQLRLLGLDEHLLLVVASDPAEGTAALDYLSNSRQRWALEKVQIELDARRLAQYESVDGIAQAQRHLGSGELAGPAAPLLRSFSRLSQDTGAAVQQESLYNRRLALSAVEDRLDGLVRELARSNEPYAGRFRPVANQWREIVTAEVQRLAQEAEARQEIDSPYVIGVPLTEQQELFVGRTDISARVEQLLLDRRRPPILLYGQRRMGKTSLLNNLGRLLPSTIVPLFVDLQGPASRAADHAGFLYNLGRGMVEAGRRHHLILPPITRDQLTADPFTVFDEWLDKVETVLGDRTALLALDELEALDSAITTGRFDEETILGMVRHLIQHRPRFKLLLSASHTLEELNRWAGYLINVQVIHVGYLHEGEARQLIERPVTDFALRYESAAAERVLQLTRCHPFLVQLLCAEIVALKNEQEPAVRRLATLADVEAAVPAALAHGSFFFADIERNQVEPAALPLLQTLAAAGEGATLPLDPPAIVAPLLKRDVLEAATGGYRFQVELIRHWFAKMTFPT
jgi:hypothetical protein